MGHKQVSSVVVTDQMPQTLALIKQLKSYGVTTLQYVMGFYDDESHVRLIRTRTGEYQAWYDGNFQYDNECEDVAMELSEHRMDDDGLYEIDVESKTVTNLGYIGYNEPEEPEWSWS